MSDSRHDVPTLVEQLKAMCLSHLLERFAVVQNNVVYFKMADCSCEIWVREQNEGHKKNRLCILCIVLKHLKNVVFWAPVFSINAEEECCWCIPALQTMSSVESGEVFFGEDFDIDDLEDDDAVIEDDLACEDPEIIKKNIHESAPPVEKYVFDKPKDTTFKISNYSVYRPKFATFSDFHFSFYHLGLYQ